MNPTTALDRLLELTVLLGEDLAAGLARDGLTESRAHLMWVLGATGPSPQRPLAEALGVTPRTVTGLVDGLVETGFVTREPHPTDRRATLVTPTAQGVAAVASLQAGRAELARQLFGDVPADEVGRFVLAMDDVLERLRATIAADGPS